MAPEYNEVLSDDQPCKSMKINTQCSGDCMCLQNQESTLEAIPVLLNHLFATILISISSTLTQQSFGFL